VEKTLRKTNNANIAIRLFVKIICLNMKHGSIDTKDWRKIQLGSGGGNVKAHRFLGLERIG
jgi:hypothetical protein